MDLIFYLFRVSAFQYIRLAVNITEHDQRLKRYTYEGA